MSKTHRIAAEDLQIGDFLIDDNKYVREIGYTQNHMIVRCSYSIDSYPATSLLLDYNEIISIESR